MPLLHAHRAIISDHSNGGVEYVLHPTGAPLAEQRLLAPDFQAVRVASPRVVPGRRAGRSKSYVAI